MQRGFFLAIATIVGACGAPMDNPTRQIGGATEIQFSDGWNCFDGQCLRYHGAVNQLSVVGREMVPLPGRIDIADGYVTPREFNRLLWTAQRADWLTG